MPKAYDQLTERGKLRRFHAVAERVMQSYALDVTDISLIKHSWGYVYQVTTTNDEKYILRINNLHFRNQLEIEAEMVFMQAIQRKTDFVIPTPIPNREGDLVVLSDAEGIDQPHYCQVFDWVEGRMLKDFDPMTAEQAGKVGEAMAGLHNFADTFVPPAGFSTKSARQVWLNRFRDGRIPTPIYDNVSDERFPLAFKQVFRRAAARTQLLIDYLYADRSQLRFLHYDLHANNLKIQGGEVCILDFGDAIWAYPMQDMAITLSSLNGRPNADALQQAVMQEYTRLRPMGAEEHAQLNLFLRCEILSLFTWCYMRTDHPEEHPGFLQFVIDAATWLEEWLHNPAADALPLPLPTFKIWEL